MSVKYDMSKVEDLNDADKLRLISAYVNHPEPKNIDWDSAAAEGGSKSKESYRKLLDAALKKLIATPGEDGNDGNLAHASPVATPKKGRKRAAATDAAVDGGESPKKKVTRKPRTKKVKEEVAAEDAV